MNTRSTLPSSLENPILGQAHKVGRVDVSELAPPGSASLYTATPSNKPSGTLQPSKSGHIAPSSAPAPSQTPATVFANPGFDGLNQTQGRAAPPDPQIAASPAFLVEMVNVEGVILTKQGSVVQYLNLSAFFKTPVGDILSDPKILYDSSSGRWFSSIITGVSPTFAPANVTIAVSSSDDPRGVWNLYNLVPSSGLLTPDQPIIGISDDKFVVSANDFGNWFGGQVWVLSKSDLLAGLPSVSQTSFGPDPALFSVHPVRSLSSTQALYMVTVGANGTAGPYCVDCVPELFTITGVPPNPVSIQMVPISMGHVFAPPYPVEPAGAITINIDSRVTDAVWFQGKLWFTLNDGCTTPGDTAQRDCVRLTEIDTTSLGTIQDMDFCPVGLYCYYPAIQTDSGGNLAVVYGFSSSTKYPSVALTGQAATDPVNSLMQPLIIVNGTSNDFTTRYGDYLGASVDPSDQTLIWVVGEYDVTISSCGGCWRTFIDSMRIVSPDFAVSSNPTSLLLTPGQQVTSTIGVTSIAGFAGTTQLSILTSGGLSASISPGAITLQSGGSSTATLKVSSKTNIHADNYIVVVNATSGTLQTLQSVYVAIKGFTLAASSAAISLVAGTSNSSPLTVASANGFSGSVSLKLSLSPALARGPTVSASPATITILSGGSAASTLTVSTANSTTKAVYTLNVTGSSGSESQVVLIPLAVTSLSVTFSNTTTFTGVKVVTSGTLSVDSPSTSLTISGALTVKASNATTGKTVFSQTYSVTTLPLSAGYAAKLLLDVLVSPYPLSSDIFVSFSGTSATASSGISRSLDIDQNGLVNRADLNIVAASSDCSIGSPCYNPKADVNADGIVNILDLALVANFYGAPDFLPDFSLSSSASSLTVNSGGSGTSTITVASLNSFSGAVGLVSSSSPSGLTVTLSSTSITVKAGGKGLATLTVASSAPGSYAVNIVGTNGALSHAITMSVNVVDFQLTTTLGDQNFQTAYVSFVPVGGIGGFAGTVTLTMSIAPTSPALSATLSPTSFSLPVLGGGAATEQSNVGPSCPRGQNCFWVITITGTSGVLSHIVQITVSRCATLNCPNSIIQPANSAGTDSAAPIHDSPAENMVYTQVANLAGTSLTSKPVRGNDRQVS